MDNIHWACRDYNHGIFYFDSFVQEIVEMSEKKKKPYYWLSLSGIAIQMGVIIFLGAKAGQWLDENYSEEGNTYTVVLTLAAVVISMYLVIKQTNKLNS